MIINSVIKGNSGGGSFASGTVLPNIFGGYNVGDELAWVASNSDGLYWGFGTAAQHLCKYVENVGSVDISRPAYFSNIISAGGKIYAIYNSNVYEYSDANNSWTQKTIANWPSNIRGFPFVCHNGLSYFLAGSNLSDSKLYSFDGSSVTAIASLPIYPSSNCWLAPVNNTMYLFAFYDGNVYSLPLSGTTWTQKLAISSYSDAGIIVVPSGTDVHLIGGNNNVSRHLVYDTLTDTIVSKPSFASPGLSLKGNENWTEYMGVKWVVGTAGHLSTDTTTIFNII